MKITYCHPSGEPIYTVQHEIVPRTGDEVKFKGRTWKIIKCIWIEPINTQFLENDYEVKILVVEH